MKTGAPLWNSRSRRALINPVQMMWNTAFWVFTLVLGIIAVAGGDLFARALGASQAAANNQALAYFWIGLVPMLMWAGVIKYLHTRSFFAEERVANRTVLFSLYFAIPALLITALQPMLAHSVLAANDVAATAVPLGAAFISFAGWLLLGEFNDLANARAVMPSYTSALAR